MKACDVALLIKDEHVIACGAPEDVLKEDLVAELYGMEKATFSGYLGGVELKGNQSGSRIFVVAGAGSGASVYRALIKHSFSVITGILPENDIDYHIATAVGATIVKSQAYDNISQGTYAEALKLLDGVAQVIDTGFPVGAMNQPNLDLIRWALDKGKVVHTLRNRLEAEALYGVDAGRMMYSQDFFELMSSVRRVVSTEHTNLSRT
jgi:iron complex transport system ATP-binding protein